MLDDRLEPAYGYVVGVTNTPGDLDGDGSNDAAELANMTDPLNSADSFRIVLMTKGAGFNPVSNPVFNVALTTFPGLSYRLETAGVVTSFQSNLVFVATNYTRTQQVLLPPNVGFIRARRN
jgi:hypothetical protein